MSYAILRAARHLPTRQLAVAAVLLGLAWLTADSPAAGRP